MGRIITFYSFKGGVGRTMALAHVAFLAAASGQRVLMMDWDLEAPGLSYYFRGMLDPTVARDLKDQPGILDTVWQWVAHIGSARTEREIQDLFDEYKTGDPFESCVVDLLTDEEAQIGGALHYIGAGAQQMSIPHDVTYETALAEFSWADFFETNAGGALIESLGDWARRNYDLVFIDSRTGLADVAGICTMQLPDVVALCFILNRQNIDGVAKVAGAISEARGDKVKIHVVPMRTSGIGTAEEADARARAITTLSRLGKIPPEITTEEMTSLAIQAAPNVPFYETLTLFTVAEAARDPLTLDYARLADSLCGCGITIPALSAEWRDVVRLRLEPKKVTVSYLSDLLTAEPSRAIDELTSYLDNALNSIEEEEGADHDYLLSLVDTAFHLQRKLELTDFEFDAAGVVQSSIFLLRRLYADDPGTWRMKLVDSLERFHELTSFYFEPEEELSDFEEMDELLSVETPQSQKTLIRRIGFKRRVARICGDEGNAEAQLNATFKINDLLLMARKSGSDESHEELLLGEAEMLLLRGDARRTLGNHDAALSDYKAALAKLNQELSDSQRTEGSRIRLELHLRLMQALRELAKPDRAAAANHALEAAEISGAQSALFTSRFREISLAVAEGDPDGEISLKFVRRLFYQSTNRLSNFCNFYARTPRSAAEFLKAISMLFEKVVAGGQGRPGVLDGERLSAADALLEVAVVTLAFLHRRVPALHHRRPSRSAQLEILHVEVEHLGKLAQNFDLLADKRSQLHNLMTEISGAMVGDR